jgi:hypothetical protein
MRSGPISTWGGARANAGRPVRGPIPSEPHKRRPPLSPRHAVHVTARVIAAAAPLSRRLAYAAIRRAVARSLARADFRIVSIVVRARRVEAIVEADSALALARGMQGFQVAAARRLNRAHHRRGTVFPDRYRMRVLATRAAVRAALAAFASASERVAYPASYLLRIELVPLALPPRVSDPDP